MTPKKILASVLGVVLALGVCSARAQTTKFLADRHAGYGVKCDACHTDAAKGTLKIDKDRHEACVQCHGWYDAVAAKTQPKDPEEMNPHSQHDGNLPCSTCHKGHKKGENYCGNCHYYTFNVP